MSCPVYLSVMGYFIRKYLGLDVHIPSWISTSYSGVLEFSINVIF